MEFKQPIQKKREKAKSKSKFKSKAKSKICGKSESLLQMSFQKALPQTLVPRQYFSCEWNATSIALYLQTKSIVACFKYLARPDYSMPFLFNEYYENLWSDFLMEVQMRRRFRTLLYHWRLRQIDKKPQDLTDPITFMPIESCVTVYDMKMRRKYCFEANSLIKSITKNLFFQQYTMPDAQPPKNVITNTPFSSNQLMSLYEQLKSKSNAAYFVYYRKLGFLLPRWKLHMLPTLSLAAIQSELNDSKSADGRDIFLDFVKDFMETAQLPLTEYFETFLEDAVEWYYDDPLLSKLRSLCINYYESRLFRIDIHNTILCAFINLYKKHIPGGTLWKKVIDRQIKETEELRRAEAMEVDD
jgi:hypothetical protein